MANAKRIALRWTLGDVSARGFEALHLSICGAWRIFGDAARYAVCVNTISPAHARRETGDVPAQVIWHDATRDLPPFLDELFDHGMAEGVAWKLAPLRMFPDCHEISLDNDCVLWELPASMKQWLNCDQPNRCLLAEDVKACFGQFAPMCGAEPRNAGVRGLPPGFDLDEALRRVLERHARACEKNAILCSETDEQGLQTAALSVDSAPTVVTLDEVTVCSPFYPHLPHLGYCGAHFVGLNARHIPWNYYDRSADECMTDHWHRHREKLYRNVDAIDRAWEGDPGAPAEPLLWRSA